ncbi:CBS domain-containing protein [Saccharophagus degradans]|uniref:CBS domain-containing protein n=1 Tax=Saccharophagus degradans TaxID=86304 RepID=A0AAW7X8P7_9GAMM|nr:CBS domain-containing protein [Saccharophagus degradans]MDO6424230.1 CBS domain-containing protein [Saccharophagus degradans]MDO6608277.1 CBS domain-containing protein [Saccharophagus degradans]
MSIKKMMTTRLITVSPTDTVGRLSEIFAKLPIHHVLVVEADKLIGVVSDRDVLRNISPFVNTKAEEAKDTFTLTRQAKQIMSKKPVTIRVDRPVREAGKLMLEKKVSLLPVVDENEQLIGVLSWKDVMRFIVE